MHIFQFKENVNKLSAYSLFESIFQEFSFKIDSTQSFGRTTSIANTRVLPEHPSMSTTLVLVQAGMFCHRHFFDIAIVICIVIVIIIVMAKKGLFWIFLPLKLSKTPISQVSLVTQTQTVNLTPSPSLQLARFSKKRFLLCEKCPIFPSRDSI